MPVAELGLILALRVAHTHNSVSIAAVRITPAIFTSNTKRMAVAAFVDHAGRPAADAAACSRRLQSRQRAFADDIALELGLLQFSAKR